jgi:hypothetical protein
MCSQSKGIGSADISASTYDKIRTIPARLHCASHRRDRRYDLPCVQIRTTPELSRAAKRHRLERIVRPQFVPRESAPECMPLLH